MADAESHAGKADPSRLAELQRRFEVAAEEARSFKRKNSELEEQVLGMRAIGMAKPAAEQGSSTDWESTKKRLLASLETDPSAEVEQRDERITIENTILITDDIVAEKDREIGELKLLLAQQSSSIGSMAVGASAIADALGQDELIQQERHRLAQLEEQWRTKIRQAEIDISVERAKIARDRAAIDDKLHDYASNRAESDGAKPAAPGESPPKPARGRWLTRLGLQE